MKRSMNVNIFLKQFKMSNEEVVRHLRAGETEKMGSEKLRGLLNILPESDEVPSLVTPSPTNKAQNHFEKFFPSRLK